MYKYVHLLHLHAIVLKLTGAVQYMVYGRGVCQVDPI
jgi:hypothetical protein